MWGVYDEDMIRDVHEQRGGYGRGIMVFRLAKIDLRKLK